MRFNALQRAIAGAERRTLTLTLRGVERDGLMDARRSRRRPEGGP
nr:winged helix-turn-helix transcriptional regulator [Methylocapsa sp. S129]